MIVEVFIKTLLNMVKFLFNGIKILFPFIGIPIGFGTALGTIISTTSQANNFIHFMLGDTAYILLVPIGLLITYKYVAYPIVTTVLGIFVNKAG